MRRNYALELLVVIAHRHSAAICSRSSREAREKARGLPVKTDHARLPYAQDYDGITARRTDPPPDPSTRNGRLLRRISAPRPPLRVHYPAAMATTSRQAGRPTQPAGRRLSRQPRPGMMAQESSLTKQRRLNGIGNPGATIWRARLLDGHGILSRTGRGPGSTLDHVDWPRPTILNDRMGPGDPAPRSTCTGCHGRVCDFPQRPSTHVVAHRCPASGRARTAWPGSRPTRVSVAGPHGKSSPG